MAKSTLLTPVQRRTRRGIFTLGIVTLVASIPFVFLHRESANVTYAFVLRNEWVLISEWIIDSRVAATLFLVLAGLSTVSAYLLFLRGRKVGLFSFLGSFALLMAFLSWAANGSFVPLTGVFQGALLLAVPLIFGAMAGVICERSGVINIAIEGQLLAAAFAAGVIASLTQSTTWGLIVAPFAGALISVILATFAIKYQIDQVVLGFVINVLVIGLTGFLYKKLLIPYQDTWNSGPILSPIEIPLLSKWPVVGPVLFNQTIIVYLMYATVILTHYYLFKTRWGLRTRAVGEHPTAADSVGIKVNALRYRNVIIAGAIAGIGGAYFTVGAVGMFSKEMTAGKGFIALAALIFGKWSPKGAVAAALLFGFADNLQVFLSIIGTAIPSEFLLMVPYIVTIIAVSGFVGKVRAPAADGIPYTRGSH
ncbi:MAG: ABC transporter permease [Actinomycetota bacterium]